MRRSILALIALVGLVAPGCGSDRPVVVVLSVVVATARGSRSRRATRQVARPSQAPTQKWSPAPKARRRAGGEPIASEASERSQNVRKGR